MRLKDMIAELVGSFTCSIENNTVLCTGIERSLNDDSGERVADAYIFDVIDLQNNTIPHSILVIFNQVGDKLIFIYKKDKFEVISFNHDLITVRKDGIDYFIKRVNLLTGV